MGEGEDEDEPGRESSFMFMLLEEGGPYVDCARARGVPGDLGTSLGGRCAISSVGGVTRRAAAAAEPDFPIVSSYPKPGPVFDSPVSCDVSGNAE